MMNDSKEQTIHSACKAHLNKSEKDLFRLYPSKLNKSELEDMYFELSDSNIQLKKTINSQREQIKVLNTKVQRLTTQKTGSSYKDCCNGRVVINNQKESIADLKRINENLSERIRVLNMRLCSAKQFLRRSPQSSYCTKCFSSNTCIKNMSTSALNTKRSEANLRTGVTSSQFLEKENAPTKLTRNTSTQVNILFQGETCQQNKCRITMEELTQKIAYLKVELSKTNNKYSDRLSKLEVEVNTLRTENVRVRAEHSNTEHKLQATETERTNLLQKLRDSEEQCDNLKAQLMIEKGKVLELETQIKASDISKHVAKALEAQMKNSCLSPLPNDLLTTGIKESLDKTTITSDDSGYTESNTQTCDKKMSSRKDENVLEKIAYLQAQLDSLKYSMKNQNNPERISGDSLQKGNLILNEKDVINANSGLNSDIYASSLKQDEQSHSTSQKQDALISTVEIKKDLNIDRSKNSKIPLPIINEISKLDANNALDKNIPEQNEIKGSKETAIDINRLDHDKNRRRLSLKTPLKDINDDSKKNELETSKKDGSESNNYDIDGNYERNLDKKQLQTSKENVESEVYIDNRVESQNLKLESRKSVDNNSLNHLEKQSIIAGVLILKETAKNDKGSDSSGHNTFIIETKPIKDKVNKSLDIHRVTKSPDKYKANKVITKSKVNKQTIKTEADVHAGATLKVIGDSGMPKPLATSSPSHHTYLVGKSVDVTRASSPDNTECEISSLTDLPNEVDDKNPVDYISPGEERGTISFSDSYATTTTDYYLSEGELPFTEVKKLSLAEVGMKYNVTGSIGRQSVTEMEEALQAINEEIKRCRNILQGQQMIIPSVARVHKFAYPYNYTFPLE